MLNHHLCPVGNLCCAVSPALNSSSKANTLTEVLLLLSSTAPGEKRAGLTQLRTTDEGTQGPLLWPSSGRLEKVGSYCFS